MGDVVNKVREFNALQVAAKMKWDAMVMEAIGEHPEYTNTTRGKYHDLCDSEGQGSLQQLGERAEGEPQNSAVDP